MNLAELLEFAGKTEQIKSLIDNRVCVHIKNKTERMFDSPDIEMNLSAANTLVILSGHKEARRLIREVAIPELKDIAEDEDSSDVNRLRAKKMADRLEKVISDE